MVAADVILSFSYHVHHHHQDDRLLSSFWFRRCEFASCDDVQVVTIGACTLVCLPVELCPVDR